ncbi:glycosyltransferase 87 family protein [Streptacidiphilus monticola]
MTCANLVLLGYLAVLSCRLVGWPGPERRPHAAVAAVGFGVWLEPVYTTLRYGQINLLIAVLVLADVIRADRNRFAGIGLGIAAGLKVTPWFFIVYLLLTGRFRTAGRAVVSFLATIAVGAAFLPGASWGFWTKYLYQTRRVGKEYIVDNQSVRGMVDRILHTTHAGISVTLLAGLVAVGGLALAVLLVRRPVALRRPQAWSVVCCAVTMLLISPISWTHHWVWCVPLLVLLAAEAAEERARLVRPRRWRVVLAAVGLAFCANSMWLVPHKGPRDLAVPAWLQAFAAPYPLLGLALLGLGGWRYLRRARPLLPPGGGLARVPEQASSRVGVG